MSASGAGAWLLWGRLDELFVEPAITPAQWCTERPCVPVAGLILDEPLGAVLVFALALLWIGVGVRFLCTRDGQRARFWLGLALVLGGLGAAQAGLSYQAFGFELKCAGRERCLLTNGLEVGYSLSQALSVSAMLVAVAHACLRERARRAVLVYAGANAALYFGVVLLGTARPSGALLSFELLMLFALPGILLVMAIARAPAGHGRGPLHRALGQAAIGLLAVQVAHFGWAAAGITEALWAGGRGFRFSENDVLHAGMIGWLFFIHARLGPHLHDADPRERSAGLRGRFRTGSV